MKQETKFLRSIQLLALVFVALGFLIQISEAQNKVTSPEEFFGFKLGSDRKIARWDKIIDYFGLLE